MKKLLSFGLATFVLTGQAFAQGTLAGQIYDRAFGQDIARQVGVCSTGACRPQVIVVKEAPEPQPTPEQQAAWRAQREAENRAENIRDAIAAAYKREFPLKRVSPY